MIFRVGEKRTMVLRVRNNTAAPITDRSLVLVVTPRGAAAHTGYQQWYRDLIPLGVSDVRIDYTPSAPGEYDWDAGFVYHDGDPLNADGISKLARSGTLTVSGPTTTTGTGTGTEPGDGTGRSGLLAGAVITVAAVALLLSRKR